MSWFIWAIRPSTPYETHLPAQPLHEVDINLGPVQLQVVAVQHVAFDPPVRPIEGRLDPTEMAAGIGFPPAGVNHPA